MIAVITGDIENSGANLHQPWLQILKDFLGEIGQTPRDWEIYRGDEFQFRIDPENALSAAVKLKAAIKTMKGIDVRLSIGLGDETYHAPRISEANGTAYTRSGRQFSDLKRNKINLAVNSGDQYWDKTINLVLKLASDFMDGWSQVSAEFVNLAMTHPHASQQDLADILEIKQSAISQRQKRARWPLIKEMLNFYKIQVKVLAS